MAGAERMTIEEGRVAAYLAAGDQAVERGGGAARKVGDVRHEDRLDPFARGELGAHERSADVRPDVGNAVEAWRGQRAVAGAVSGASAGRSP